MYQRWSKHSKNGLSARSTSKTCLSKALSIFTAIVAVSLQHLEKL